MSSTGRCRVSEKLDNVQRVDLQIRYDRFDCLFGWMGMNKLSHDSLLFVQLDRAEPYDSAIEINQ